MSARRLSRCSAKSQSSDRASNEMKNDDASSAPAVEQSELQEKVKIFEKADELLRELNSTISDILAAAVEVEAFLDTDTVSFEPLIKVHFVQASEDIHVAI